MESYSCPSYSSSQQDGAAVTRTATFGGDIPGT